MRRAEVPNSGSDTPLAEPLLRRPLDIAFVNELSRAAAAMNISFREVVSAASTKPFGYMPFHHGPGVGGRDGHGLIVRQAPSALAARS